MATLLEKLKQSLGQVGTGTTAPGSAGAEVEALAAAKEGVVGPRKGLRATSLTEKAAEAATKTELAGVGEQAQMQATATGQAAAGQTQQQAEAEQDIAAQRRSNELQTRIRTEQTLQELEQKRGALSEDARRQRMEKIAADLRLGTQKYTDELALAGAQQRLSDATAFDEALARDIMQENLALVTLQYKNEAARDLSDRDFEKMLASMNASDMLAAYRQGLRFEQTQGTIQAGKELTQTAGQLYGAGQQGQYDQDYKSYKESTQASGQVPMSYSTWQKRTEGTSAFVGPPRAQAGK